MRKFTFLLVIMLFIGYVNNLYSDWDDITTPTNNNLLDIHYSDPHAGYLYAVGPNQTIIKSTNNGQAWTTVSFSGTNDFTAVYFYTETFGYVGGLTGDFLRTLNGGSSWLERDPQSDGNQINDIEMNGGSIAVLVGKNGIISYSTNSGYTWIEHNSPTFSVDINSVRFIDDTTAIACGDAGLVIISTDGGVNWTILQSANKTYDFTSIDYKDADTWVVSASNGNIYRTVNGGSSFTQVHSLLNQSLKAVRYAGSNRFFAVGSNGKILISNNSGTTWENQISPVTETLNRIEKISSNVVVVAGNNGTILYTSDAGGLATWTLELSDPNSSTEWISGRTGTINWTSTGITDLDVYYSTDNGANFTYDGNVAASTGTYTWNIPNGIESDECIIKLEDADNSSVFAYSQTFSIIDNNINISSPVDGDEYKTGETISIEWTTNIDSNFEIFYAPDGTNYTTLATVPSFAAGYEWTAPNTYGKDYKIRMVDVNDNLNTETIDGTFTVWDFNFTAPVQDEIVYTGRNYLIEWNSTITDNVKIYITNGTDSTLITTLQGTTGQYNWNVPSNFENGFYHFLMIAEDNDAISEISGTFAIFTKQLDITSPLDGEEYKTGDDITINWDINYDTELVISYTTDNITYTVIDSVSSTDENYIWTAPAAYSTNYQIRINDLNDALITETMNGTFTVWDFNFTAPIQNETVLTGRDYLIEWNSTITDNVKIYITNGTDTTNITTIVGTANNYNWFPVPAIADGTYWLFMIAENNEDITEVSDEFEMFTKILEITSPEDGDIWNTFEEQDIEWNINYNTLLTIEYTTNLSNPWTLITDDVDSDLFAYKWTSLPDISGTFYLKITDKNDSLTSDVTLACRFNNRMVKVNSPNGNERLNARGTHEVKWEVNNVQNIDILFSADSGKTWISDTRYENVNALTQNYINWDIPLYPSDECFVKIVDSQNDYVNDMSDMKFSILGLRLDSFNDGGTYLAGSLQEIDWTYEGTELVDIYFSSDNGTSWTILEQDYRADEKPYMWAVPQTPGVNSRIRIIDSDNSIFRDESDVKFTIKGLKVTNPEGGEIWLCGTEQDIEWETNISNPDEQYVNIEYTTDNGRTWITIDSYVDISLKSYTWDVPKNNSEVCMIRISYEDASEIYDISNEFFTIDGSGIVITSPTENDVWNIGTQYDITWAEANVNKVDIYYSTDKGANWTYIGQDNASPLSWTIPNSITASTECYIRIADSENSEVADTSDIFKIKRAGGAYDVPDSWTYTPNTGSDAIIIIPTGAAANIIGNTIDTDDAIGVFYLDNGIYKCAGYGKWNGANLSITVWGDNPMTSEKDGFGLNENYNLKLWDGELGVEHNIYATYSTTNGHYFFNNNVSVVSTMSVYTTLKIPLTGGIWQMISSNRLPVELGMEKLMYNVDHAFGEHGFMKDEDGQTYFPFEDINTIGDWNMSNGYQIYVEEDEILEINGIKADLYTYRKTLEANKWHIVSYLPLYPMSVVTAVQSVMDGSHTGEMIIVKNDDGEVYYSSYGIDQIGDMVPGEGYKLFTNHVDSLQYPVSTAPIAIPGLDEYELDPIHYEKPIIKSGNNAVVVVESSELTDGDEIGVFDNSEMLIGSGVYQKGRAVITVWGDNTMTDKAKEGAKYNETLKLRIFENNSKNEYNADLLNVTELISGTSKGNELNYYEDAVLGVELTKGNLSSVDNIETINVSHYPNPASTTLTILSDNNINELKVYNINGDLVDTFKTLTNKLEIDLSNYSSGVYYYMLNNNSSRIVRKFSVIK